MEGAELTENMINGVERPVKGAELFAFTLRVHVFFFQAEDGIRDVAVTGVQTCALPISGLHAWYKPISRSEDTVVIIEGKERIMMGSNNYLGLTHHPDVLAAAKAALDRYGSGCTGSRLLNGTLDLHVQLEAELAEFFGKEACVVFSTGYQANLGVVSGLVGRGDLVFLDKLDHPSIVDGAKLPFGETHRFAHGDLADVDRRLPGGTRGRDPLPALQRPAAGLQGCPAAVQHRRRAGRPACHAARAGAPRAPVAQCPPHPGRPPLAGLRHRHDGDTHHSVPHRRVREDADLLAQAVRRRRVHESRGAAGAAAVALPPADQRDGHAHGRPDRLRARDLRQARKRVGGRLSAVRIAPVSNGRGLERFIAFPYDHHRGDPQWVAPLRMDVRTLLSPKKNPFFRHAEAQYFVAQSEGRTVGRIAAIKNDAHNREHHDRVGFYGFFESVNDQTLADALFDTAAQWLRHKGCDTMRGPMSPSINDECGLLVHGFETPPTLMMPHNPPD